MCGYSTLMGTHIYDLFPEDEYRDSVERGHIRVRPHSSLPYLIHGYTEACVWEGGWNTATMTCRGLVTHSDTGEVVARPFRKFFGLGQPEAGEFDLDSPVEVTEKVDGSLGILVPTPDGWMVSTRGSFASVQSDWATACWQREHADFQPNPAWTYLFEIVYHANRIVLPYDFEGLVLLGAVDIATGRSISLAQAADGWNGRVTDIHPYRSLREVLASGERDNAEGFVVHDTVSDVRIKVKHEQYVTLHKIIFGATTLSVWEALSQGLDPAVAFADAPDEFHQILRATEGKMRGQFHDLRDAVRDSYDLLLLDLNARYGEGVWGRREFAGAAQQAQFTPFMFLLLDGKDIDSKVWQAIRPAGGEILNRESAA